MNYKILESPGIEITHIDDSRFNNFLLSGNSGIIPGSFDECTVFQPSSNSVGIATGELLIKGFRIQITSPFVYSFAAASASAINYHIVARLTLYQNGAVEFTIVCREKTALIQDDLYQLSQGVYEIELGSFIYSESLIVSLKRTAVILGRELLKNTSNFVLLNCENDYPHWDTENKTLNIPESTHIVSPTKIYSIGLGNSITVSLQYSQGMICYDPETGIFSVYDYKADYLDIPRSSLLIAAYSDYGKIVNMVGSYKIDNRLFGVAQGGATFIPNVSEDGTLSWTNDQGLENPDPVNIAGAGIENIEKIDSDGSINTYRITYANGNTFEYSLENGKTAYEYAKEGGYTGTEQEFAQKLAKELPTKLSDFTNDKNFIDAAGAPVQSVNDKTGKVNLSANDVGAHPSTWMPTAEEVGADKKGTAASLVSIHNTDSESHNDIRLLVEGLNSRLNALANSEDVDLDQMKELVDYIKDNRGLIEQITTNKVNYTDIIDNLTTNVKDKPLSAAQGVALKTLIDALDIDKLDASELSNAINTALAQAKASGEFDGKDGKDGTNYVLTDADLSIIAERAIEILGGQPIFGVVDANRNIILSGNLSEGTYIAKYEKEDGTTIEIGQLVFSYLVKNNLTNCKTNNNANSVANGGSYSATITANDGYEISSIVVTMGGTDVSSTVVSGGTISIASVTGDIVITAIAEETVVEIKNWLDEVGYEKDKRISLSSGTEKDASGYYLTGFIPATSGQTVRIKGIDVADNTYVTITSFDIDKQPVFGTSSNCGTTLYNAFVTKGTETNGVYACTLNTSIYPPFNTNMAYIRITSQSITDESVITVDQEII